MTTIVIACAVHVIVALVLVGLLFEDLEEVVVIVALFWPLTMWVGIGLWIRRRFEDKGNR